MRRAVAVASLAVAALTTAGPGAVMAASSSATSCGTSADGGWTLLPRPSTVPGPLLHVEASGDGDRVLVTADAHVVARSDDGGCTWRELLRVPDTGRGGLTQARVQDVDVVVGEGRDVVLVTVTAGPNAVTLLRSEDGAAFEPARPAEFVDSSDSAPCAAYSGCELVVSEADPTRVFLTAGGTLEGGGQLWRSDDLGATFELVYHSTADPYVLERSLVAAQLRGPFQLRTDPADPDALVAVYDCDALGRSEDGGRTWTAVARPGDPANSFSGLAARRASRTAPQSLLAVEVDTYCSGTTMVALHGSRDGGATWTDVGFPGPDLHAVELDSTGQVALVVDELGVLTRVDLGGTVGVRALSPPGGVAVRDPEPLATAGAFALAGEDGVLLLQLGTAGPGSAAQVVDRRRPLPPLAACAQPPAAAAPRRPSSLDAPATLDVPVGGRAEVDVEGSVGGGPVPVDLAFLVDDSGSMAAAQASLARSVGGAAERLRAVDVDVHVGLARFADLVAMPYQRMLDVGPVDCRLDQRLAQFDTSGVAEPHLLALEQLVVGDGVEGVGLPPGEAMTFRDDALRLVLHATDEPLDRGLPHSPDVDAVGAAYVAAGVQHVGIHVEGTNLGGAEDELPVDADGVRSDLTAISRATGSLATAPIDCNGDGLPDVPVGAPLVCGFDADLATFDGVLATELGSIAAQVVEGLVGPVDTTLVVEDVPAGMEVGVRGGGTVDPRRGGVVPGTLAVACGPAAASGPVPVRLELAGRVVARAVVEVGCVAPAGAVGRGAVDPATVEPAAPGPRPPGAGEVPAAVPPPPGPPPVTVPVAGAAGAGAGAGGSAGAGGGAGAASSAAAGAGAASAAGAVGAAPATSPAVGLPATQQRGRAAAATAAVAVDDRALLGVRWHDRTTLPWAPALATAVAVASVAPRRRVARAEVAGPPER